MTTETSGAPAATATATLDGVDLVVTRTFDAPREVVFAAWTDPGHFARWYAPREFTVTVRAMDVRPGGVLHFCHHWPGHEDVWAGGVYREVVPPERLVYTDYFADEAGNRVERPGFAPETLVTVTFAERAGGGTEVTVRHAGLTADRGELQGWTEILERLDDHLHAGDATMTTATTGAGPAPASTAPGNREGVATRVFDAPRELVWEAMTRPEHLRRWYGPRGTELVSCDIDLRPGGAFRYVLRTPEGHEAAFSGVYREVVRPERVVNTWEFEAFPGHGAVETATLKEEDGRTTVRLSIVFQTPEDYAGWAGAGAYAGWAESLDRLAELVAGLS